MAAVYLIDPYSARHKEYVDYRGVRIYTA